MTIEPKRSRRAKPPAGWRVPDGRCECGCGAPTAVASITRRERDQYAGHPMRYLSGHSVAGRARGAAKNSWKGGRYTHTTGYVYVYAPDHPNNRGGHVLEHRLVYERTHGVLLAPTDVIHHANGIRDDNRPENLFRVTRAEHTRIDPAIRAGAGPWRTADPERARRHASEAGKKGADKRWARIVAEHVNSTP